MTRFQKWLTVAFLVFVTAVAVTAQNPVSILQVGRATAVGTTLPISGTVTANAGTNLNTSALSTEATLSTLNGKVTAVNTGAVVLAAGTAAIGKLASNTGVVIGDVNVVTTPAATYNPCMAPTVDGVAISTSSSGNTELKALSGTTVIYVCGWDFEAAGTVNVSLISGHGTACATGETAETGVYQLTAQTGLARTNGGAIQFRTAAGDATCIKLSGSIAVAGQLSYVQQ